MKKIKETKDGLFGIEPLDPENPHFRKTSEDDPIWKTRKYYICQTGGMPLWIGLQHMRCIDCMWGDCLHKRKHEMDSILSFPYEVSECKCKNCRFFRIYKK